MSSSDQETKADLLRKIGWSEELIESFLAQSRVPNLPIFPEIGPDTTQWRVVDSTTVQLTLSDASIVSGERLEVPLTRAAD